LSNHFIFFAHNNKWIVDVISCVVSVKKSLIIDGRLLHKDIGEIWKSYDTKLHDWILQLTEEFDLSYRIAEQHMNIVPCLLPECDPEDIGWTELDNENSADEGQREYKVVYTFKYLPAGLFNRIQVRLFQYGESSSIWRQASLLRKNNHRALLLQAGADTFEIRVQGAKPENVIFLIHEVIETLVGEFFNGGITYEYSFPCPYCVECHAQEPGRFTSVFLRRAHDLKAPFLLCDRLFHPVTVPEMLAIMPVEGLSSLDLNLEYSLRGLKQLKNNLKYDIFFWYCPDDVVDGAACSPLDVIKEVKKEEYKVWFTEKPREAKMDIVTAAIKQSRLVILGISDKFSIDQNCLQVYELVKNVIKKNYLIVEFGDGHVWLQKPTFASVCTDVRIIMQEKKRYAAKLVELLDQLERLLRDGNGKTAAMAAKNVDKIDANIDVFISYCWSNSHDAVRKKAGSIENNTTLGWLDPRDLQSFFTKNGIDVWLDINEIGSTTTSGLFGEITKGLTKAKLVIACVSDEYVKSENCSLEFSFAHSSLKLPIIKAVVGTGNKWQKNKIAFMGLNYPEFDFQKENKGKFLF
jgi:hypothetical protein